MTRRERLENKLSRRREWADKAAARSNAECEAARKITEHIPFGQPILVGHYSESAHRNAIKRSAGHMDKSVEAYKMAEHHADKAAGLEQQLKNSVFSDDPDAIERLQEKLSALEHLQEQMKGINKIIRSSKKLSDDETIARIKAAYPTLSDESAREIVTPPECLSFLGRGIPSYHLSNNNANIRRIKERIAEIQRRQERRQAAENAANGVLIEGREYISVTFSEKPEWTILHDLKSAGFYWRNGSWHGSRSSLPESVLAMAGKGA